MEEEHLKMEFEDNNDSIRFSNNEADLILSIANEYSLGVHDLILLSVLSIQEGDLTDTKYKYSCGRRNTNNSQ